LKDKAGRLGDTGKVVVEIIYDEIGDYYKNTTWAKNGTSFGLIIAGKFGCNWLLQLSRLE